MSGNSPSLKIVLDEHLFCLHPRPSGEDSVEDDLVVQGSLNLSLAKSRKIKRLTVRIMCDHAVYTGQDFRTEKGECMIAQFVVRQFAKGRSFLKGEHQFSFVLNVPSSAAPFQVCSYGATSHTIVALLEAGKTARSNIQTCAPIFIVANPAPIGVMRRCQMQVQNYKEETGPYLISTASEHLTVGGLISFEFKLVKVPQTINILSVAAHLETTYRVMSIKEPTKQIGQGSQKIPLVEIDRSKTITRDTSMLTRGASGPLPDYLAEQFKNDMQTSLGYVGQGAPFQVVPARGSFQLSHLIRLPSVRNIRPSTPLGSNTPVQVSHELVLTLTFTKVPPGNVSDADIYAPAQRLCARGDVIITSCCCMITSFLPETPDAEAIDDTRDGMPRPTPPQLHKIDPSWECVCSCSKAHRLEHVEEVAARLRQELAGIQSGASGHQGTEMPLLTRP